MLSRKCPTCSTELNIKSAQVTDYYVCTLCDKTYKEAELLKGLVSFFVEKGIEFLCYTKENNTRTIVLFSGYNSSAKNTFARERLQRYVDQYNFDLIIVSIKQIETNVKSNYRLISLNILTVLANTLKINIANIDFIAFSSGGILLSCFIGALEMNSAIFISAFSPNALFYLQDNFSFLRMNTEKEKRKSKVFIINQDLDDPFFSITNSEAEIILHSEAFDVSLIHNPNGKHRVWDTRNILFSELILLN